MPTEIRAVVGWLSQPVCPRGFRSCRRHFAALGLAVLVGIPSLPGQSLRQLTDFRSWHNSPAALSGDGSRAFYLRSVLLRNQSLPGTLFLREGESDPPRTLAREVLADWMIASQDGSYLLFGVHDSDHSQADSSRIFSLDVSTGKTTDLLPFSFNTGFDPKRILLVEQIGRVLVNSFRGEKTGLLSIPLEGGEVESILPQRRMKMTTDPAGRFLYYTLHSNEIWRLRFEDGERTMVHRLTASSSIGALFVSREGDLLTIRTSLPRIYQYDASNGRTRRLFPDTDTRLIDVSGNGEWMLIESSQDLTAENPDGSRELFLCGINGGNCRQLTRIASPGLIRPLVYDPPPPQGIP